MNAATINRLVRLAPPESAEEAKRRMEMSSMAEATVFAQQYANPAFGHYIAKRYAAAEQRLPVALMGSDAWVHKAWLMCMDPRKWYNPHIAEAKEMAQSNILGMDGEKIRAVILAASKDPKEKNKALENIAGCYGVPLATINAFENLFYNIFDRAADNLYLAHQLYPHTRAVELREDYLKTVTPADLLKRAAYNHKDMRMTLYLSGVGGSDYLASLAERPDREVELGKRIIGNALILACTGLLNQRSIGIQRGQTLLAASRAGGSQEDSSPLDGIGPFILDALSAIGEGEAMSRKQLARQDAGVIIDVD